MTVRELVTKWGFEVEHDKLDKVEKQLEGIKHTLEFLAAAEVLKGVFELTEKFAHFAEELHVAAEAAGITVETFQKLAFAAGQSAISQEEMGASMARLSRHLYEARKGGAEAQAVFAQAGFTPAQVNGFKTGSDVMLALADRFKTIQDPIQKQALAMQLMGRGSINMVAFLSKGSGAIKGMGDEAERLGVILSHEQVEALVRVEHAMMRLWAIVKSIGATFASFLAPNVEEAIDSFTKFYEVNRKVLTLAMKEWVNNFAFSMGFLWGIVRGITQTIIEFATAHSTLAKIIFYGAGALGAFAASALVGLKVMAMFMSAIETAKKVKEFTLDLWSAIKAINAWGVISKIATAAQWLWNTAVGIFTGEITLLSIPVIALVAGLAALILVGQALWKVFTGGKFSDTWIGQMANWVGSFKIVQEALEGISGLIGKLDVGGVFEKIGKMFGGAGGITAVQNIAGAASIPGTAPGFGAGEGAAGGGNNYSVNAPITVNVPAGSDHKVVGEKVKEGVKEHLDRVYRETNRSLRPSQSY